MIAPATDAPCVLLLVHNLDVGGGQRLLVTLASEVERAGWRVVVCAWRRGGRLARVLADRGIPVELPETDHGGWRRLQVPAFLDRVRRRHDAAIVHAHLSDSAIWGGWLHGRSRTPLLITHHSPDLLDLGGRGGRVTRAVRMRLLGWAVRRAWGNVAVSDEIARELRRRTGVPPDRIHVAANGIPLPPDPDVDASLADRAARRDAGFRVEGPLLVSTGRLSAEKRLDRLVAAVPGLRRVFPHVRVVLVGEGPEGAALRHQAEALGVGDRVSCPGAAVDVAPWLRRADAFVAPSALEGTPLAVLEALAWGVPVVASHLAGHVALLGDDARGRLFDPERPEALVEAVIEALRPGDAGRVRVARGRDYVREHHDAAGMAARYLEWYRRMIQR